MAFMSLLVMEFHARFQQVNLIIDSFPEFFIELPLQMKELRRVR